MGTIRLLPQNRRSLATSTKDKRELVFPYGLTDDIDRLLFKDIWTYELFFDRDAIIGISNYAHFIMTEKNYRDMTWKLEGTIMNILMIEDNQSVSEMMQMFFLNEGWEATFKYDGKEGLDAFLENPNIGT